ncbi:MAG: hypothetical protein JSS32_06510 [Verrucomicrobia bacterium]|nr:hypothetical protein [Verrucomicrobiota bacterium]
MEKLEIVAYGAWGFDVKIVPAFRKREWMEKEQGHAYHCLPMAMANQSGWFILAPYDVTAVWDGTDREDCVKVETEAKNPLALAYPHTGILSWTIPYVFRTPPGWNLLCRGPANMPKDGVWPLEGLIETDWSMASFSMNWKFTRPGKIEFKKDEPYAMLVPHMRKDLEHFSGRFAELSSNPELFDGYTKFMKNRTEFIERQQRGDPEALKQRHQKIYWRGFTPDGEQFPDHQMSRKLAEFQNP